MTLSEIQNPKFLIDINEVLLLFSIPFAGGIPAGVMLAKSRGIGLDIIAAVYFISDVLLALLFDPAMKYFIRLGRRSPPIARFNATFKKTVKLTTSQYGDKPNPLILILIAFGVDPMTGRVAAYLAGHGFFAGWAIAIIGDMIFFGVVLASTLWLSDIIGDPRWTTLVMTVVILIFPAIYKRVREKIKRN